MLDRILWQKPVELRREGGVFLTVSTARDAMDAIAPFAAEETAAFISARDAVIDVVRGAMMQDHGRRAFITAIKELGLDVSNE